MANVNLVEYLSNKNEALEEILLRLFEKFKQESESQQLLTSIENCEARLALYTGIPVTHLQYWYNIKMGVHRPKLFNLDEHIEILKTLTSIYMKKDPATAKHLLDSLENVELSIRFNNLKHFEEELATLGINYHTFNGHRVLMEDPTLTCSRFNFIQQITKAKLANTTIYYVSERIIDKNYEFKKRLNGPATQSDLVFFHAISCAGVTNGMLCQNPSETDFSKWLVDVLIKHLQPQSLIVLDNSLHYGSKPGKPMSLYNTKRDMFEWLLKHNIPCSLSFSKAQLYELLKRETGKQELSHIEQILLAEGFKVLKIPDNFYDLSPLDEIWDIFRQNCLESMPNTVRIKNVILHMLDSIVWDKYQSIDMNLQGKQSVLQKCDKFRDNYFEEYVLDLKTRKAEPTDLFMETEDPITNIPSPELFSDPAVLTPNIEIVPDNDVETITA